MSSYLPFDVKNQKSLISFRTENVFTSRTFYIYTEKPFIDHLLNCSSEKEQCSFILCVFFNMCLIHTIAENATNSTRMQIFKLLKITNKTLCITCTLTVFCMIKLRLCLRIIFFQGDLSWLVGLNYIL